MTDSAQAVFTQTVIMFMIVVIGAVCYKTCLINDDGRKQLSNLVLNVVNPLLIFLSYQTDMRADLLEGFLWTALMAAVSYVLFILAARFIFPKKEGRDTVIERFSAVYSNFGFMGTPLIFGVFGSEGVFMQNGFVTVSNLFIWTHGVMSMTSGRPDSPKASDTLLRALRSPAIIAVAAGLVMMFTGIKLPGIVYTALNNVAEMTTPLAMIVAGASIMSAGLLESVKDPRVYLVSAVKLLLLPALGIAAVLFMPCADMPKLITIIEFSCPAAAIGTMFAIRYDRDSHYASQIFAVSTVLSAVTLPFVVYAVSSLLEVMRAV